MDIYSTITSCVQAIHGVNSPSPQHLLQNQTSSLVVLPSCAMGKFFKGSLLGVWCPIVCFKDFKGVQVLRHQPIRICSQLVQVAATKTAGKPSTNFSRNSKNSPVEKVENKTTMSPPTNFHLNRLPISASSSPPEAVRTSETKHAK